jgi:enoyl-CoA hydratase/carnithine racemase
MLGSEGWKPTATEAAQVGFVERVVPHDELLEAAQKEAEERIANGTPRSFRDPAELAELKAVNARESVGVADSFLGSPFLEGQFRFLWRKKKRGPAGMFLALRLSRPLWSRLL